MTWEQWKFMLRIDYKEPVERLNWLIFGYCLCWFAWKKPFFELYVFDKFKNGTLIKNSRGATIIKLSKYWYVLLKHK